MKKLLLSFLAACTATIVAAQPTLTAASNPVAGDAYTIHTTTVTSPGNAGANQTWDFSAQPDNSSTTLGYQSCAASPNCSMFPGTTVVGTQSNGQAYSYFLTDATRQAITGIIAGGVNIIFSNQEDVIRYPFTYGTTYTDAFAATFTSGVDFHRAGTITVTGDGYGTLKTPAGTYPNALRVRRQEVYTDTAVSFGQVIQYTSDVYTWYTTASHEYLYNVGSLTAAGSTSSYATYRSSATDVTSVSLPSATVACTPNPVSGLLKVRIETETRQPLRVSLMDMGGREVAVIADRTFAAGSSEAAYDVSTLPRGLYGVCISGAGGKSLAQKIVVQ